MNDSLKSAYYQGWIRDKSKQDSMQMSQRVVATMRRFFKHVLGRSFAGRLLDVGCGDGSFVEGCRKEGLDAVGIDIKDGVDFEHDRLPFKEDEFDIVFMYSVLEHINDPSNLLSEVRRVLARNGLLIVITPNMDQVKFKFYDDPTHVRPYNPKSICWLMGLFNFQRLGVGLWTVNKSPFLWRLPEGIQFAYGRLLPFSGLNRSAPSFLKGKSKTMLCAFSLQKEV